MIALDYTASDIPGLNFIIKEGSSVDMPLLLILLLIIIFITLSLTI